jgi:VPDSG-CTERM motif
MKTLIPAAIRCSLMFTAVTASLFFVRPVQGFTITMDQMGSNVVANGSGAFNLTGLTFLGSGPAAESGIIPSLGFIAINAGSVDADVYVGFTGPTSFGSGDLSLGNSFSGDFFALEEGIDAFLALPQGYVSGAALSNSMTFNNATFASLGMTPGTYVWSWGTGLPNQNFTLIIGRVGVPDGGSTISLLGCALLGFAALRRTFSC